MIMDRFGFLNHFSNRIMKRRESNIKKLKIKINIFKKSVRKVLDRFWMYNQQLFPMDYKETRVYRTKKPAVF